MESRDPRDPFDGLWMAALLMAAPLVAWWAWSEVWVTWAFQLKRVELKLLHALGLGTAQTADLSTALQSALTAPDKITFDAFFFGLEAVGSYLSGPVAAGLVGLGIWLIGFHPAGQFRRRFDLWRLAEAMRVTASDGGSHGRSTRRTTTFWFETPSTTSFFRSDRR